MKILFIIPLTILFILTICDVIYLILLIKEYRRKKMNKSKKELYEENQKLRKTIKTYGEFWETDAIDESIKQMRFTKKSLYIASVVLLIINAFLLGLAN